MTSAKLILCVIFIGFTLQEPSSGWRGILPFHSTRADVERLLGTSLDECKCLYETSKERIRIDYSIERCGKGERNNAAVPPDTVLGITVNLKRHVSFCELRMDATKLKKTEDPELRGYAAYTNEEEGVEYNVKDDGRLYSVTYFGTLKDRTNLRCRQE